MEKEIEWYSNCCDAPPLHELYYPSNDYEVPLGSCMKCREGAVFRMEEK